ncbi:MAG: HEAT repeat domain-containing protein [Phycisphaerales bacterium]
MSGTQRLLLGLWLSVLACLPGAVVAQEQTPASLWEDFNHYVLIAKPDLALATGQALLQQTDNQTLLSTVESSERKEWANVLARASKLGEADAQYADLVAVARDLDGRIQAARVELSRDPQRIQQDIELLAQGQRAYRNATQRLAAAGQYAAPHMLATLLDQNQSRLHPYILSSMVTIGQPLVAPLSAALPQLDPVAMSHVAQVLAEIGYPQALPAMKEVLESPTVDASARQVVQVAYNALMASTRQPADLSAAEWLLQLGQTQYTTGTSAGDTLPGYDASIESGLVWTYGPKIGLIPIVVPGEIFGDVLAMRSAKRALELNDGLDQALSLYLMANLRRENRLPADTLDPSYPSELQPAGFYAMLAGPDRLHDVLARAIQDADAELALDAIEALSATAGTEALVHRGSAQQPLLNALSYPDRRVRFRAAEALAKVRPSETFTGAHRVTAVLAEAVRQSDARYAMVIANDEETVNKLKAVLRELGFEAFGGLSMADVSEDLNLVPGIDLIVAATDADTAIRLRNDTANDYKTSAVPILAIQSEEQNIRLKNSLGDDNTRVRPALMSDDTEALKAAVESATASYTGESIGATQSNEFALSALALLRDVAIDSNVFQVTDAQPALTQALSDERDPVKIGAANVLALIDNGDAQRALAETALSTEGDLQLAMLASLADSATYFGNHLSTDQTDRILELVQASSGDLAIAAARAHGALSLPTANAVKLLTVTE